jgi:mannose-1-phosphate guanylyltransferase/mannose-6-phosphate isomerase
VRKPDHFLNSAAGSSGAAPALATAALHLRANDDDPLLLVLPADHVITELPPFHAALEAGRALAEAGHLVTFGIRPTHPETGYGYIKAADEHLLDGAGRRVARFVEKPDLATAQDYLASGDYFWNSGMFLFRAGRFLDELERLNPAMLAACRAALADGQPDLDFVRLCPQAFAACPEDSIDYAVMELTPHAAVVSLDAGWSDIGAWSALWQVRDKDGAGNALRGDVLAYDSRDCLALGETRLVALVGVEDLVVVDTQDAVLVAHRERAQEVKKIVDRLKAEGRPEVTHHREVFRPWGSYHSIDSGERFQVKRITVKPGERLSLQMHHHRAEHWIVVRGTAEVRCGDKTMLLTENQSTYIPLGDLHQLANPGKVELEIIEVQSGSYLGEDDIVRFEDRYGRA